MNSRCKGWGSAMGVRCLGSVKSVVWGFFSEMVHISFYVYHIASVLWGDECIKYEETLPWFTPCE
jgi:hypothetical protein